VVLISEPRLAYTQVSKVFYRNPPNEAGIDPRAVIAAGATIGVGCQVEAGALVGEAAPLSAHAVASAATP
jgi:UDP-3-O-[3-hydroxymyristoyl] glucosamine N-acyltransferase